MTTVNCKLKTDSMTPTVPNVAVPVRKTPLLAWVFLCLMALVWGSSFILIKRSLAIFPTTQVAAGRIFFAFLFFLPVLAAQSRKPETGPIVKTTWWAFLVAGTMGFLIPAFLFAEAGAHLSSSLSGALNSLSPLFTLIMGALFFGNKIRLPQLTGILIGLVGALLLIFFSSTGSFTVNGYALLVVVATVCYGTNTNFIGRHLRHLPALTSTAWLFAFIGPVALAILLTTDFFTRFQTAGASLAALATLGVVASGMTSILFNRVLQMASPLFAASVTYLIPIVALLWGVLDGEQVYAVQYVGIGLCLLGIYLTNRRT
jgi:drug/metabolite transporter (DMT)-like permease